MTNEPESPPAVPSVTRRVAALPYEALLLVALILIASFPFAGLKDRLQSGFALLAFQGYLFSVSACYFTWLWRHGGQTLAMKTWRIRLIGNDGRSVGLGRAFARFVCALLFFGPAGVGLLLLFFPERISPAISVWAFLPLIATVLWARFDVDRQFLHDRLVGTRLVSVPR